MIEGFRKPYSLSLDRKFTTIKESLPLSVTNNSKVCHQSILRYRISFNTLKIRKQVTFNNKRIAPVITLIKIAYIKSYSKRPCNYHLITNQTFIKPQFKKIMSLDLKVNMIGLSTIRCIRMAQIGQIQVMRWRKLIREMTIR